MRRREPEAHGPARPDSRGSGRGDPNRTFRSRCSATRERGPSALFWADQVGALVTVLYTERRGKIIIPKFRGEAAEAEWWDNHPEVATEIMKRAMKASKARRAVPLKTVTMRLPVPDIEAAQDLAQQKGLRYQTYIKMLLHEALERERRSA